MSLPIFITRVHIAKGPGVILISLSTPAGELGNGPVENVEAMRVAMTIPTFQEVTALFSKAMENLQLAAPAVEKKPRRRSLRMSDAVAGSS